MSGAITAAAVVVGGASLAASAYSGEQQRKAGRKQEKAQDRATKQAESQALKQEKQQEQEINRSRTNRPNADAMLDAANQSASGGAGSTLLTGSQGVDTDQLNLGKNTLLGS